MTHVLMAAVRNLQRRPVFAVAVVATMAIGSGAATALLTIVDHTMLRRSSFAHADRLVDVFDGRRRGTPMALLPAEKLSGWRAQPSLFERFEVYAPATLDLTGRSEPMRVSTLTVSVGMFEMIGVNPVAGRTFEPGEGRPGSQPVAVISLRLAQRLWPHWQDGLGAPLQLNGVPHTVIGVLEASFVLLKREEVWLPVDIEASATPGTADMFYAIGRLAPGVTVLAAQERANHLAARMQQQSPIRPTWAIRIAEKRAAAIDGQMKKVLGALFAAALILMLLTCVNVSLLQMSRLEDRWAEHVTKMALGAGRCVVVAEVVAESVVLGIAGAAGGLLSGSWLLSVLVAAAPAELHDLASTPIAVDGRIMLFAVVAVVAASVMSAGLPAVLISAGLNVGSRGVFSRRGRGSRLPDLLVAVEVACTVALSAGAVLMARNAAAIAAIDPGFAATELLEASIDLPVDRYPSGGGRLALLAAIDEGLQRSSSIRGAAVAAGVTFGSIGLGRPGTVVDTNPLDPELMAFNTVSPDYFSVMGIPLLAGRVLAAGDTAAAVVINKRLAENLWPGGDAIGRRFLVDQTDGEDWRTVVGVVGDVDVRFSDKQAVNFQTYEPWSAGAAAEPERTTRKYIPHRLIVRTADPAGAVALIKGELRRLDPAQPLERVRLVSEALREPFARQIFSRHLLSGFAIAAVSLSIVAVFSVTRRAVSRRSRELGLRMAVGATPIHLLQSVVGRVSVPIGTGLCAGVVLAMGLCRALEALLVGAKHENAESVAFAAALVAVASGWAALAPALRATRLSPAETIRDDAA